MAASSSKAQKVNIAANFKLVDDYWSPRIAGAIIDSYVKPARWGGELCGTLTKRKMSSFSSRTDN
jgi:hypothetical protein